MQFKPNSGIFHSKNFQNAFKMRSFNTQVLSSKVKMSWLAAGATLMAVGCFVNDWKCAEKNSSGKQASEEDYKNVKKDIENLMNSVFKSNTIFVDESFAPILIRLAWISAGNYMKIQQGKGESYLLFHPDQSSGGTAALQYAKDTLELVKKKYPGISYADFYTLAGALAIKSMGGPEIAWKPGRKDISLTPITKNIPSDLVPDSFKPNQARSLRELYYGLGFSDKDIVCLGMAHALSRTDKDRSKFAAPWTNSPSYFSNVYYRDLLSKKWIEKKSKGALMYVDPTGEYLLMPSDIALVQDEEFKKIVEVYAKDQDQFFKDFAGAFSKIINLGITHNPDISTMQQKDVESKGWWSRIFH